MAKFDHKLLAERIGDATSQVPESVSNAIEQQLLELESANEAPGLPVGERAPDFSLSNRQGQPVSLAQHLQRGPVVLSFLRGAWCPICSLELEALQEVYSDIRALGAELIAITPQDIEHNLEFGKRFKVEFPILSDADQEIGKLYKLHFTFPEMLRELYLQYFSIDVAKENADTSWGLPVPATYILRPTGEIYTRFVEMNYLKRLEPSDILAMLRQLQG